VSRAAGLALLAAALLAGAVLAPAGPAPGASVPSPASVLGFRIGEDRKLADWDQIVGYFRRLDAASDRVRVDDVGQTTEGRAYLVAILTSPLNHARLDAIRRTNLRLADPRGLGEAEAERLVDEGRAIVSLNHGIHSTEVAGSLTAMETAYRLASGEDRDTLEILDRTVVVMLPSQNPDGTHKVAEWNRRTLGTPYEGADPPFLYHAYAGHDDNRDWYMFTQRETRLAVENVYEAWRPQIVHDLHQMGRKTARMFLPPYVDPWEPNVDPALRSAVAGLGSHVAARLTAEGRKGVLVQGIYDAWSPSRAYPHTHGGVRILSEAAGLRLASPVHVPFEDLEAGIGYDPRRASWNFPDPWPGGDWRLQDVVDYQLSATRALLQHAARHREEWLRLFLGVNRRASARTEPYAFVVPAGQRDGAAARKLLEVLATGGVELHLARGAFQARGRSVPAGSHVIRMAQPASAFAKTLLETQRYPDMRPPAGGPPHKPYDVTAHTLPLLLGVEVVTAAEPFAADLERVAQITGPEGRIEGRGRFLALGHKSAEMRALGRLLRAGAPVRWATEAFADGGRRFEAGTLLVPASARARLAPVVRELGLVARGVDALPPSLALRQPRVALYQSFVPSMDEGWTRFVLETWAELPYVSVHDRDVRRGGLAARFDVLVLADQKAEEILKGHAPGALPDEYCGGLGPEGAEALRSFVEDGGTLIALNRATAFAVEQLALPVANVLAGDKELSAPGSILRVSVDASNPIAHGLDDPSIVWFEDSPAFEVRSGRVVARYVEESPLLSGFLLGGERLKGRAALAEVPRGRGRVVLFGFRPQYRAQSWATIPALLNAVYLAAAR
jgi:hypothetical protein